MQDIKKEIIELYKKYATPRKGIYRKKGIRPGTDWRVIVFTSLLIILCSVFIHTIIYIGVKNNSWWSFDANDELYRDKVNKELLTKTLELFREENRESGSYKNNEANLADPSL